MKRVHPLVKPQIQEEESFFFLDLGILDIQGFVGSLSSWEMKFVHWGCFGSIRFLANFYGLFDPYTTIVHIAINKSDIVPVGAGLCQSFLFH